MRKIIYCHLGNGEILHREKICRMTEKLEISMKILLVII